MSVLRRSSAGGLVAVVLGAVTAMAAIELTNSTLDGGGFVSQGPSLQVTGTIAQPDVGVASGGTLELRGGFWATPQSVTAVEPTVPSLVYRMGDPSPNPFNPKTRVRFELAQPGPTTVRVYNVAGRLVRELINQTLPAGPHDFEWDGRDNRGQSIASGSYHIQMRSGNFAAVRKATLVK